MKRKPKEGSLIQIQLEGGSSAYGQVLNKSSLAIFNSNKSSVYHLEKILKLDVLFIICVENPAAFRAENWHLLGKKDIRQDLAILPNNFIQDALNPKEFSIYNPNTGDSVQATKEDCIGLERAAVWGSVHVEERILNHFNGINFKDELT